MTERRGPQIEQGGCWNCGGSFTYTRLTRPRRYCSRACELERAEVFRSLRRMQRARQRREAGSGAPEPTSGPPAPENAS